MSLEIHPRQLTVERQGDLVVLTVRFTNGACRTYTIPAEVLALLARQKVVGVKDLLLLRARKPGEDKVTFMFGGGEQPLHVQTATLATTARIKL